MPLAWYIVPYKRYENTSGGFPGRVCGIDDFTAQIWSDNGWPQGNVPGSPEFWSETEILGNAALVKVRASQTTLDTLDAQVGWLAIPKRFLNLLDGLGDLLNGEKNQIENVLRALGYSQAEIDAVMGNSLSLWRQKSLDTLLGLFASRRLKVRYDQVADAHVFDGPQQPVKSHRLVASEVA